MPKPDYSAADAATIRKWAAEHAADEAERDEETEREAIIAEVSEVLGAVRTRNIVLDVFDAWMAALTAARRAQ